MHKDYITKGMKKRVPMILALTLLAGMIALNVCVKEPEHEPDSVFPMANAKVSWENTYYPGPWEAVD